MRIERIETIPLKFEMGKEIWDAVHRFSARQALIVKVYTEEGITGYGESAYFGGPIVTTATVIEKELAPFFIGQNPFQVEYLWDLVYRTTVQHGRRGLIIAALSGIDIALWDIIGKAVNKPLYQIIGWFRQKVEAYASAGFYTEGKGVKELCREMESYAAGGFKTLKMKVGGLGIHEDLERAENVRKAIGNKVDLAVDANSNWDVPTARLMGKQLENLGIKWIEEPVSPDDIEGSAIVAQSTVIPISGYEQETTRYGFRPLIENRAVHIVQPDVTWSGGITECKRIAALASSWNLPCRPHVFSSGVCLAANLHFIASIPNGDLVELDRNFNPLRDFLIFDALSTDSKGMIALPDRPGLGIELNPEIIKKYRCD